MKNSDVNDAQEQAAAASTLKNLQQPFPGASISIKNQHVDLYGKSRQTLALVTQNNSVTCWLSDLEQGIKLSDLPADAEQFLLSTSRVDANQAEIPAEAFLHAAIPSPAVIYFASEAVLSLSSSEIGKKLLSKTFQSTVVEAAFKESLRDQANAVSAVYANGVQAIVLPHRGLLVAGSNVDEASKRLSEIEKKVKELLKSEGAWETTVSVEPQTNINQAAAVEKRKQISHQVGSPLIIGWTSQSGWNSFPLEKHLLVQALPYLQPSQVVKDDVLGVGFIGGDAEEETIALGTYIMEQRIAQREAKLGKVDWLQGIPALALTNKGGVMRGEVALVTGAASGIGKACVHSFLARGAAVVGLDVNPAITTMIDQPSFLGIHCDLTNEDQVRAALVQTVQKFGGLDMMVLNAGIFPSSKRIEVLSNADFNRVITINLYANLTLMREAHLLLKNSPRGGRLVANASRNALAPGVGAAAYSVSKMALTQLARVAALEWGEEGIHVNVVHPDAVFDTGVWSEEILKTRAANYNMTVDQYKRRNVLKTELVSTDVSEMIVEMCGPLFSKVTGAQLPVDGGSDRVI